jgi:hypothetical protein
MNLSRTFEEIGMHQGRFNKSEKVVSVIILLVVLACLCFGADYSRFVRVVNGIEVAYGWVECPVEMLDEPIPNEAQIYVFGARTDEQGNVIPHEPKTLREFVLGYPAMSLDGTTAVIAVGARHAHMYRTSAVGTNDFAVWDSYLSAYGFDSSKWLDSEQYRDLLMSERYNAGGME